MQETDILTFSFAGLDGIEKKYHLRPIMRKEACWVFDTFLKTVVRTISESIDGVSSLLSSGSSIGTLDLSNIAKPMSAIVNSIEFDTLWKVADLLFRKAMVIAETKFCTTGCTLEFGENGMGDVGADFFRDHPDELYIAVAYAINANWPAVFTNSRARIEGLLQKFARKKPGDSTE